MFNKCFYTYAVLHLIAIFSSHFRCVVGLFRGEHNKFW